MREATATGASRVLAIANVDLMAAVLLRPWLQGLRDAGFEVHVACAPGAYVTRLERDGFVVHPIPVRRTFNPLANIHAVAAAYRLLRRERFAVVNTHSPTGAAVGRIACWLAGVRPVVYTVHGFYFHDDMAAPLRWLLIAIEWCLARFTSRFMFVSEEDRLTALRTGIVRDHRHAVTIFNGVDSNRYRPDAAARARIRAEFGIADGVPVVGIVGRIVREKGYREFVEMATRVKRSIPGVRFLVIGDSLPSDRDHFAPKVRQLVAGAGLTADFVFAGFRPDVDRCLCAVDVFVLPSYREGFPRSVLEAMATGLPVVATDIRGCREAVRRRETGLIVPARDSARLADAVLELLRNPRLARRMGDAGRRRAVGVFNEEQVRARFVGVFEELRDAARSASDAELSAPRRPATAGGIPPYPRHESGAAH